MFPFCYTSFSTLRELCVANIDDILEKLLNDRRVRESAAFTSRTFSDQPIIERGSDFRRRVANRDQSRAAREARRDERERRIEQREATRAARRRQQEFIRQKEREQEQHEQTAQQREQTAQHRSQQQVSQPRTESEPTLRPESWSGRLFSLTPEPIRTVAESLTGTGRLPSRIREMRRLEKGGVPSRLAYGSTASAALFYRQARLMEDYEDNYEFHGTFSQYYPTYAAMSDHQLRGYFSWRTQVRAGNVRLAPVSFAYVYLYELLCGIGTVPGEQGLSDLRAFGHAWQEVVEAEGSTDSIQSYLTRWMRDYAIYHGLTDQLFPSPGQTTAKQALVLLRAEHAQLAREGRKPHVPNKVAAHGEAPSQDEIFRALSEVGTYHLSEARLAKSEPALVAAVATDVFAALVGHCSRRRKTDFVEGLFGYAYTSYYTMFSAAVFYEEEPHPDTTVLVDDFEEFVCKSGHWSHSMPIEGNSRSKELGKILHRVDFELRRQLNYAYPLKEKPVPKYVDKIVRDAITARLEERAEAERRRITIDRSKLRGIRAAAAVTQEALLTEEERSEEPVSVPTAPAPVPQPAPASMLQTKAAAPAAPAPAPAAPAPAPAAPAPAASDSPLTVLEARFLQGLLDGTPATQLLGPGDPFVSVVADSINEKFFDLVGDTVIDFDGDEPCLIEDYLDDIREVLNP